METYQVITLIISGIILQIGLTLRLKIKEKSKEKRIEKFEKMDDAKVNAIGNYEEKSKSKNFK
ncbi:hypothetical protein [Polaribacter sp. Q13]|uniref:hypothetical protein n=1 Tax=Polaribacter sp. Q13 TaxID=2806551 RepID=UPI00193BC828|nr:hypothetical protein [Polaribacter sp. Q13]QVY65154.1 hypothetical protein JOP69_15590 [Polaribacter sp. Q13]